MKYHQLKHPNSSIHSFTPMLVCLSWFFIWKYMLLRHTLAIAFLYTRCMCKKLLVATFYVWCPLGFSPLRPRHCIPYVMPTVNYPSCGDRRRAPRMRVNDHRSGGWEDAQTMTITLEWCFRVCWWSSRFLHPGAPIARNLGLKLYILQQTHFAFNGRSRWHSPVLHRIINNCAVWLRLELRGLLLCVVC